MADMGNPLHCHPQSAALVPASLRGIEIAADFRSDGSLEVTYSCDADLTQLRLPAPARPEPADELWRHSCCELFVGSVDASAYREFNFSPSGQWAIYDFSAYRVRRQQLATSVPQIRFSREANRWQLIASLPADLLPPRRRGCLEFLPAVVLESAEGGRSYWALAHPRQKPDFHDRSGFVLRCVDVARRSIA
jgi:hypothetical protein